MDDIPKLKHKFRPGPIYKDRCESRAGTESRQCNEPERNHAPESEDHDHNSNFFGPLSDPRRDGYYRPCPPWCAHAT